MPKWEIQPIWNNEDVFIIGGGSSLKNFDWNLLKPELTIGCNAAFLLGSEICKICIFCDTSFFNKFKKELVNYTGILFTNSVGLQNTKEKYLWTLPRISKGLSINALGFGGNTGCSAINLALLLGAKRVFLLGMDADVSVDRKSHWHNRYVSVTSNDAFRVFKNGFSAVAADLSKVFPNSEIINISDVSKIDVFPKISPAVFWKERLAKNGKVCN